MDVHIFYMKFNISVNYYTIPENILHHLTFNGHRLPIIYLSYHMVMDKGGRKSLYYGCFSQRKNTNLWIQHHTHGNSLLWINWRHGLTSKPSGLWAKLLFTILWPFMSFTILFIMLSCDLFKWLWMTPWTTKVWYTAPLLKIRRLIREYRTVQHTHRRTLLEHLWATGHVLPSC